MAYHRRGRAALSVICVVITIAACGTTVRDPNGVAPQGSGNGGLAASTPGVANPSGAPGSAGASLPGVPGASSSVGATGGALPTSPGGGGTVSTPGPGTGPGTHGSGSTAITTGRATLSPVSVGMVYISDADAFAKLFGGTSSVGNQLTEATAAVNWINANGGLNGHPIAPEYYKQSITNTAPYSTSMAAICSAWTQDQHMAAGLFIGGNVPDDLGQCLNAKGVTYLSGGFYLHDQTTYAQTPHLFSPYEAGSDRAMSSLINYLLGAGKLTTKSKVGVLLADNEPAASRTYSNVIVPMLKAKGISVNSYDVEFPASTLAASQSLGQVSNDQLHMRADGITNVFFMAPGGEATFIKDAQNQNWKPAYDFTSIDTPWGLTSSGGGSSAKVAQQQLPGSVGIGWEPVSDIGTYGTTSFGNSETSLCNTIEGPTGQVTNNQAVFAAYQWCDALLSLRSAADALPQSSTLTGDDLASGFTRIGPRTSAMVLASNLSASQHDGASEYRPLAYETSCSCFQYTGAAVPFS